MWDRLLGRAPSHSPRGGGRELAIERGTNQPGNSALVAEPAGLLGFARRWSPAFAPVGAGLALFALMFLLAQRSGHSHPILTPSALIPLAVLYVVGGLLFGAALNAAPSTASWMLLLIGGLALYPLVTAVFIWGWPGVLVLAVFMGVGVAFYSRSHFVITPDHHVQVTRLGKAHLRTLLPGGTIALPGERILTSVETIERTADLAQRQVRVESAEGTVYVAGAIAQVNYRLIASQAHRAFLASARWEDDVRVIAARTLDDALGDWAVHLLDDEQPPEGLYIARTMLRRLRERLHSWGIQVIAVNVQQIRLVPETGAIPADWPTAERSQGESGTPPTAGLAPREYDEPSQLHVQHESPAPTPPPVAPATPPALPDDLSPEALSALYEAVRVGRITDPATIRSIAHAFLTVAADPALNDTFPYDAVAAARILLDLAANVEGPAAARNSPHAG